MSSFCQAFWSCSSSKQVWSGCSSWTTVTAISPAQGLLIPTQYADGNETLPSRVLP
uniref:Uncharacterized protein n=1 Tax=Arundo donax TaxID=35708 RepID=A0A0A9BQJ8_ARUDO